MKHEQVSNLRTSTGSSILVEQALRRSLFVIPSINGAALLARMLPTLRVPGELILVLDQGSTDSTEEVCGKFGVDLVQLGTPHTYTKACNIGARLACERNADYLFILNNDITFTTDVARELLEALISDPGLGIVAPSQVIIDAKIDRKLVAYRVRWDLSRIRFEHDFEAPGVEVQRLEADFCELTCAAVRMRAIDEIGFLDDEYGFYHEDADFCFRLRQAGYACAYLPQAQIEHYHSSTFSEGMSDQKRKYLSKNKELFARKFLGYGVHHQDHRSTSTDSWSIINRNLHPYLHRFGLINPERPELIFSHPGTEPFDYLYTVWETTQLPPEWLGFKESYKGIFTPSNWVREVFEAAGYHDVKYLPHGVETDVFHQWGPAWRLFEEKTYLWLSHNQHRKGLDVLLNAWARFFPANPRARLAIVGTGVLECLGQEPAATRHWKNFIIAEYPDQGITLREVVTPLTTDELASLYRGVDFLIVPSRSEGFGFTVAEAMSSGTLVIFPDYAGTREFGFEGALMLRGRESPADYSDKGFGKIGSWWEPDVDHLVSLLHEAQTMDLATRRDLANRAARNIRQKFTWRDTCLALHKGLTTLQEQRHVSAPGLLEQDDTDVSSMQRTSAETRTARHQRSRKDLSNPIAARFARDEDVFFDFDPEFYLRQYKDVAKGGMDPLAHYLRFGWKENRNPSAEMTTLELIASNPEALRRLAGNKPALRLFPFLNKVSSWRDSQTTAQPDNEPEPSKPGVLLIGYVEAGLGLGESLRGLATSLAETPLPFSIYPFNINVETRLIGPFMESRYDRDGHYDVNIIEMAADQLPGMFKAMGAARIANSYNIFRTYWELPAAPREWAPFLEHIDEIWAPTEFVKMAFRSIYDGPITLVPPCVELGSGNDHGRAHFGLDRDRFYFMFSFDYYSSPARKNPLGVLRAFQRAFPDREENVGLIIKSTSSKNQNLRIKGTIAKAAAEDPRIIVLDRVMSRNEVLSLIRQSDCYVSLHRSEGFGLGMTEAMSFGNIVIGTDFSGSTDFLSERTGFPVGYMMRALRQGEYPYSDGQSWAEADEQEAAEAMRRAFYDQDERRRRSAAGKAFVQTRYSRENVGRIAEARLMQILSLIDRLRNAPNYERRRATL
jgi:glycosyltransferase involved in cell wall biosynthesis